MRTRAARQSVCLILAMFSVAAAGREVSLVDAVKAGDVRAVRSLLRQRAYVNATDPDGATALSWAVYQDAPEMVSALLDAKADPNIANRYGVVPLFLAAANGNAVIVNRLLSAGADPNAVRSAGETPLMVAARTGHTDNVALEFGGDVNDANDIGDTPLHGAAFTGANDLVRLLVDRGAKLDAKNTWGQTPLAVANLDIQGGGFVVSQAETEKLIRGLLAERNMPPGEHFTTEQIPEVIQITDASGYRFHYTSPV